MNCYIHPSVSSAALNAFFKRNNISGEVHSIKLIHKGETMIRLAIPPYSTEDKRESYSLSKSFTSTAIGMLVTEGKLTTDARIVDLFPDKCPAEMSENLAKMRLSHVLSMNTGHESCVMDKISQADDAVAAFLAQPVVHEPGTHFAYNTGATCILAAIVEKLTGMSLLDYITVKLFIPMGIFGTTWHRVRSGIQQGGTGICVNCDDIAALGQLYLNKGVFGGKRYLSEEWVETASSKISDNSNNGTADWCVGYGYQLWRNAKEGYRGDGAFGQLMMVFPEREMVVAIQGMLGDMWAEVESVYDLIDNLYDTTDEPLALPEYAPRKSSDTASRMENKFYKLDQNPTGLTGLYITRTDNTLSIHLTDGANCETITAGNGYWADSTVFVPVIKPNMPAFQFNPLPARTEMSSSFTTEEGKITLHVRFRNCPHHMIWTFIGDESKIQLDIEERGFMAEGAGTITGVALGE
ncbi:MAG: serine hydrolase [Ruminococcaceae bacterium]|nr:serine hydrolase [Oscillospiraceae bacterium]